MRQQGVLGVTFHRQTFIAVTNVLIVFLDVQVRDSEESWGVSLSWTAHMGVWYLLSSDLQSSPYSSKPPCRTRFTKP